MSAKEELTAFITSSVLGVVNESDKVTIKVVESGTKTITFVINCEESDLRFVFSRLKAIKFIAIAIAQKNKAIVNLIVDS